MNMSNQQYWAEVNAIAAALVAEAMQEADGDKNSAEETINDHLLHETIDGHQWVIYYSYNLDILQHSNNSSYMIDNLGLDSAGEALQSGGLSGLHCALAFWALYADVQNALENAFDDYENGVEMA